jgi:CubicO group peptidase (beta-lactamase class C family)
MIRLAGRLRRIALFPGLVVLATVVAAAPAAAQLPRSEAQAVGLSPERLGRVRQFVAAEVERGRIPGAVVAIARRGKLVYLEATGYRDKDTGAAMKTDAIFSLASMTKPMASVAAMLLVEDGRMRIGDPVGKYLPALADMQVGVVKTAADGTVTIERVPAPRQPTIQDLLRHTSGVTYGNRGTTPVHKLWPRGSSVAAFDYTGPELVAHLGTLPLLHEPGTRWDYSLSVDVLGLAVEAVVGKPLGAFLAERLWRPLKMVDTSFTVSESALPRYARAFAKDPITGEPLSIPHAPGKPPLKFDCGGACAVSTTSDYVRFAQMMLNRGTLDGARVLARKTVEFMTADHLGPEIKGGPRDGYGFGLGFAVRRASGVGYVPGSPGDYSWAGAYGTTFWIDPKEELVVVFMSAAPGVAGEYNRVLPSLVYQALVD